MELIPLNSNQHVITFVPRLITELPFFNLTTYQKNLPSVIKFAGLDDAGHPINWEVYQNTNKEIGAPRADAHRVWYQLVKPATDQVRRVDGTIPDIVPLGKIRECLRTVGWTAGGHQERKLIRCLNQIGAAWCVADLWIPTRESDEHGKPKFIQVKGRFSRLSVYAIGERHVTEEDLVNIRFDFDLDDILYIKLDPLEARLQQGSDQRVYDNQYWFSVDPAARRWYELMAPKIFGTVKNKARFCEITYSWYVQHHHTLKRFYERRRVVEQMNRLVKDHLETRYLSSVEYRVVKEPDKEIDYVIRYYPGDGAGESIARIQGHLHERRLLTRKTRFPRLQNRDQAVSETYNGLALMTQRDAENQRLILDLFLRFGIAISKSLELVTTRHEAVVKQLEYWPHRNVSIKDGLAGWMIAAITRDYTAPPAFADAIQQSAQAAATKKRLADMAACLFCDEGGLIRIQSIEAQGQITVRICTHDPQIEAALARARNFDNISTMPSDALNGPLTNGNMTNEKRPAKDPASP